MTLVEVTFQTIADGVHSQIYVKKRGVWLKFPLYIGNLEI